MRTTLPVLAALLLAPMVSGVPAQAAALPTQQASVQPRVGSVAIDAAQLWAMQDDTTYWQGYTITLNGNYTFPDDSVFTRPIGDDTTPFTSTFDGNSKSISNLRVAVTQQGAGTTYGGLFGVLGAGHVVKDLTLSTHVSVSSTTQNAVGGALAAYATGGTITNVTIVDSTVEVTAAPAAAAVAEAGGLVGFSVGQTFSASTVAADVSVTGGANDVGYAGGIVADSRDDTLSRLFVDGTVAGTAASLGLGGVAGGAMASRMSQVGSIATVTGTAPTVASAALGGIAGLLDDSLGVPNTIVDSYAQGDVKVVNDSSSADVGGIVGYAYPSSASLTRTYYSGTVSETGPSTPSLGGIGGGFASSTSISQSYYLSTNATDVGVWGGTTRDDTALSLSAMQQIASYSTWPIVGTYQAPGANTWGICEGQSYPYLLWQASANPCVSAVSVSGTAEVGQTLTASVTATDDTFLRWGWLDNGVFSGILETNSPTYVVRSADIGHRMAVRVISSSGTASATAYSAPTAVVSAPPPPPPPPPPVFPPGAPTNVTATAGDASATVTWSAPADTGTFPITTYQVTASPGGAACTSATLTCEIADLTNGTAYTFTARALNGAGWGPWSSPSAAVTPTAPPTPTITITGKGEPRRVYVTGTSTDLVVGTTLTVWVRMGGRGEFTPTQRPVVVAPDGSFAWERKRGRGREVQVYFTSDPVASNTWTFQGR